MLPRKKEIIIYANMTEYQKNLINKTLENHLSEKGSGGIALAFSICMPCACRCNYQFSLFLSFLFHFEFLYERHFYSLQTPVHFMFC